VKAGIYLVKGNDQLVRMDEQPYDSEDLLQEDARFVTICVLLYPCSSVPIHG
jgi:hypothetical protein